MLHKKENWQACRLAIGGGLQLMDWVLTSGSGRENLFSRCMAHQPGRKACIVTV